MRDLVVTENITLDGVIDTAGGWLSPSAENAEVDQSDLQAALGEQQDAADALLVGRVTFEELRGYWPEQTDDTTGITDYLNAVSKYVVSTTLDDPDWDETTVLRAWKDDIAALKASPGQDIVATGSISLVSHALGRLKGNRHLEARPGDPTANLLLAIAHLADVEIASFGASTGRFDL